MAGYSTVLEVRRLEQDLDKLGLMMCYPKGGWGSSSEGDYVAVRPKDQDSLPIFARDAEMFQGTLRDLRSWLIGIEWARNYDMMLGLSNDKRRVRKEQDVNNRKLLKSLKEAGEHSESTA